MKKLLLSFLLLAPLFLWGQQTINPGTNPNDKTGDNAQTIVKKFNANLLWQNGGNTTITTGDLLRGGPSNNWVRIPIGSNGDVFSISSGVPAWRPYSSITPSGTATGTDTYAVTASPAITSYVAGQSYYITFTNANTGSATLNINSIGAKAITKTGTTALVSGDIKAGQTLALVYDGTRLQIIGDGEGNVSQTITNGVTTLAPSEDAVFDALALKAPLASPALTGTPTAPTQSANDNSTKIATTAYADAAAASGTPDATESVKGKAEIATYAESITGTDDTKFISPLKNAYVNIKVFSVKAYGAAGDGKLNTDGAMTSGSAVLTSAAGGFVSTDVGKYIKVAGAGSAGADLVTTITSFQSSTQVTLTANAGTTVTGRDVLWGTESTIGIQGAIAAVNTVGIGVVYFPFDATGRYIIAGALVTSVEGGANPNSQLWIPKLDANTGVRKFIKFMGEAPPNGMFGGNNDITYGNLGIVLESTILGSGTAPSVIGCSYNLSGAGGVINFTHVGVEFENLNIRVRSKTGATHIAPAMTAFDMSKATEASFLKCRAFTQSKLVSESVQPTDNTVAGFKFPNRLNTNILNYSDQIYTSGYYTGFEINDHVVIGFCGSAATVRGINFPTSDGLGIHIKRYYCEGAIRPIEFNGNTSVIIEDFNYDNNGVSWVVLDKIFNKLGGTAITGRINYRSLVALSSTNDFPATFSLIDIKDSQYGIQDLASSTSFSSLTTRIPTMSANAGRGFSILPKGTGTSATLKSQFDVFNTDYQADQTNYERLLIRAAGTDGYIIDAQAAGTGTLRDVIFKHNGNERLRIGASNLIVSGVATIIDSDISPAALAANTNNYAPTNIATAATLRISASSAVDLTGIAGGATMVDGRELTLINVGTTNTITLKNDVTSTAANRFLLNADFALAANMAVKLVYDGTSSRWRKVY